MLAIRAAWHYKDFIWSAVKSEINGKYVNSRIGGAWIVLQPLANSLVLAIVLSKLIGSRISGIDSDFAYAIYLLSGILGWSLFSELTTSTATMFADRANIIKKVNFPHVCIPLIVIMISLINHMLLAVITISIVLILGAEVTFSLIYLPLIIIVNLIFSLSLGITMSVFEVFNKDVSKVWQIVLQFWFWLTPVIYLSDILPEAVASYLIYNPMYWVIEGYHNVLAFGRPPDYLELTFVFFGALAILFIGGVLYLKAKNDVVDAL